jgi:hypothetical protein
MIEVCDPDADLDVLKKLIKMNTGHTIKLTKEQTCQVYDDIKAGKLPLPPLIMSSNKTYLVDKKSPLKPNDYDILFDSSSKRNEIKIVARKVGLKQLDQMTKSQMIDSIGKRLKYMKIHEPVKIGTRRVTPVRKEVFNNTAVMNNVQTNNVQMNNTAVNNNVQRNNTAVMNNTAVKNNVQRNNVQRNNTAVMNNTAVKNNVQMNNVQRNNVQRNNVQRNTATKTPTTRVNFPKGGLFMKGQRPKFLNGRVSAVKKPIQSIFKPKPKQTFIKSDTFTGAKKGYVFKTGNQGTGYYLNEGPVVIQGPSLINKEKYISEQKRKFMDMIANVKLSDADKKSLQDLIDNKTNLNVLKNRANKLVQQRIREKNETIKQNLLTYLTPLKINQTNKNAFITRFNRGESINVIKRAAKQREEDVARGQTENVRTRLVRNLNALGLNAQDKNTIMGKFDNGNRNIGKLVEQAENLKKRRNAEKLKTEKQRLNALAKQLDVNINVSGLSTLNGVAGLEERIRTAGAEKVKGTFAEKVQALSKIASDLNLNTNLQSNIFKIKNDNELDAMKVRIINAGKTKLSNRAKSLKINVSKNITNVNNVNKLFPLQQKINDLGAAKKNEEKRKQAKQLAERRNELKQYINTISILSQNKKNAFVRQINLNNTNLTELRKEINTEVQKIKDEKRSKNLDELEQYLQPLNINKAKFIQRFKNSNISLTNIKAAINKEVAAKGDLNSKKRTLSNKIDEAKSFDVVFNFNTNTTPLNTVEKIEDMNRKVDDAIERVINKGRNALSNKIINANVKNDFMNKVTAVKTLKNLKNVQRQIENAIVSKKSAKKEEITKYMRNLGLNNSDIQIVVSRNLSLNDSRQMANGILDKKKRLELTKLLDEKKVPVADRKQFYNKITKNSNISTIEKNVEEYLRKKSRETISNITQVLNKYNLKNEDRQAILNDWDYYTNMTVINVKNKASQRAQEFKKEKEIALRRYLQNDLKLAANDVETVMKNFNLNPRNMGILREKAKKLKNISGEKNRLTERIRKAREENKLNLNINVNTIKTPNNVKNINAKINQAYINKNKKNLSRRALNRNINISNELNAIKTMNNVQKLKNKLNGLIGSKKQEDLKKLEEVIKNLNQENKNRFLQKFKNQNNSLGNILENVQKFKGDLVKQKFEGQKQELYKYINETLNLNVKDRNSIMFEFNTSKNLNAMKQKANALKNSRNVEKIAANRKKLENILKPLNLSQENKNSVLAKYDKQPGNIESFETNAKTLIQQRKNESRTSEREELVRYINNLGLSGENRNKIVNVFNQSMNKTLVSSKNDASKLKQSRDQEKLENILKNLSNISENNKSKLRTNLKSGINLNQVTLSAKRLNATAKSRKATEKTVINYVSSKELGKDGEKLIKNFRDGLLTARKVKEEADKRRMSLNAEIVTKKKKRLRDIMKKTILDNKDKNRFINRVKVNTDIGDLENSIQKMNKEIKNKRDTFARKQTELRTFLDGLTDLTIDQRTKFMDRVKNHTTDIDRIKREAEKIDKAKKAGKRKSEQRLAGEEIRRKRAEPKEDNNFNAARAMENLNLKNYVMKSSLPESSKTRYIKQIERPGTNIKPLRNLINSELRLLNTQTKLKNSVLKAVKGVTGQYRRGWEKAIDETRSSKEVGELLKRLEAKIKLRREINNSTIGPLKKRGHLARVMNLSDDEVKRRIIFENQSRPMLRINANNIYPNSNSNNNNVKKPNMKPNPLFQPTMKNNPIFEVPKLTNKNKQPLISDINSLKQLPRNKKTMFKGRLNSAFKNQNLNKMKAVRNEAVAANKVIQNQIAEEKRLKEEAKEAQRKKEAENATKRKMEREAKKKNIVTRQLNAANNVLNLADKALKKKENSRRPTIGERGSYTSKINTEMRKLAKGTNNKVREDWEKKKRKFKGRISTATTLGQVKKAYENAKEAYNNLVKPKSMWKNEYNKRL